MSFRFGKTSLERMEDLHEDGQRILKLAIQYTTIDFGISQCGRTEEQQRENIAKGVSKTMKSRHMIDDSGFCYAFDIYAFVDGKANYEEKNLRKIAQAIFRAAFELGIEIEWGGHWQNFLDMPHYQLPWRTHPPVSKG